MRHVYFALVLVAVAAPLRAQTETVISPPPPFAKTVTLSGPRFGFTSLSEGVIEKLRERQIDVTTPITQFGWQFEKQFYSKDSGLSKGEGLSRDRERALC